MAARSNTSLITWFALTAALGGLLFGYDTAVISGAVGAIDYNFIDPRHLAPQWKNWLSGFTVGSALLGCVLGAALAGPASTIIGRRGGLFCAGMLFFVSSLGSAYPEFIWSVFGAKGSAALFPFIAYRILGGTAIGMASMLSPMYIAEIAPPKTRGLFVTFQQIAIVLGINLVYFVNWLIQSFGDHRWLLESGWRWMLASAALPAAMLCIGMLFVPETPRYYVMRGRPKEALALLRRLMGNGAEATLAEINGSLVRHDSRLFAFGAAVVIVGSLLSAFQQLVGINAILYYAPMMFEGIGASTNAAFLQAVIVGIANTVFTLVAFFTVDRLGRKPLLIGGGILMSVSMAALGTLFYLQTVATWAVVAVVVYIAGFALSWGPVVWVLLSEMFPNAIRSKALSLAVAVQWISNFLVTQTFRVVDGDPQLVGLFHHGFAYWIYAGMSLLAVLFVIWFVPETKGRSLEEIEGLWSRRIAWNKIPAQAKI